MPRMQQEPLQEGSQSSNSYGTQYINTSRTLLLSPVTCVGREHVLTERRMHAPYVRPWLCLV
jgi:hypothetical protein